MNTALVGSAFRLTLSDGRVISTRLSFGDFVRAETARGTNYAAAFASDDAAVVNLADIAMLTYQAALRTAQYEGSYEQWTLDLDGFPELEDEDEAPEVKAAPFPQATPAAS